MATEEQPEPLVQIDTSGRMRQVLRCASRVIEWARRSGRPELRIVAIAQLLGAFATAAQILLVAALLRHIAEQADPGRLVPFALALGLVTAVQLVLTSATNELQWILSERVHGAALDDVLGCAVLADLAAFENPRFHDLLQRTLRGVDEQPWSTIGGLFSLFGGVTGALAATLATAVLVPWLPLVVAAALVPVWLALRRTVRERRRLEIDLTVLQRFRESLRTILTSVSAAREIRALGVGNHLRDRQRTASDQRIELVVALARDRQHRAVLTTTASAAVLALMASVLLVLADRGRLDVAEAGAAAVGMLRLATAGRSLLGGASTLLQNTTFVDDLDILESLTAASTQRQPTLDRAVTVGLDDVWFRYPGTDIDVLKGASLYLEHGQLTAIVGPNGAGKSTLLQILAGLRAPTIGTVSWNGKPLDEGDLAEVRQATSVQFQDFLRFELPAELNIALGRHDRGIGFEGVRRAAVGAGIDKHLAGLPAGYDTYLSRAFDGGTELSAGQWQRVAIARALFRDGSPLLLDEPGTALDPHAERQLLDSLRTWGENRITVVVTHRYETAMAADVVHVLDDGQVVESGPPHRLLDQGGAFARLFEGR